MAHAKGARIRVRGLQPAQVLAGLASPMCAKTRDEFALALQGLWQPEHLFELRQALAAYENGDASLDEFADWYRKASQVKFGLPKPIFEACMAIDALFCEMDHEGWDDSAFQRELSKAIFPFAQCAPRER